MSNLCLPGAPLAPYTTLHIGGKGEYVCEFKSSEEAILCINHAKDKNLPISILGGGSNTLISDEGVLGCVLVVRSKGLSEVVNSNEVLLTAAAGEVFDEVVEYAVEKGYWGLENLSHIPGSIGATPVQNIGAYGVEICNLISSVRAINTDTKEIREFAADECNFSYRSSYFKSEVGSNWLVLEVTYKLSLQPKPQLSYADLKLWFEADNDVSLKKIREAVISIRSKKFPNWNEVGTAGSFFKNPVISKDHYKNLLAEYPDFPSYEVDEDSVKIPLGWVLDKLCGFKGYKQGLISCYEGQALVLVAERGATANDVKSFAKMIKGRVYELTKINIEWEVTEL